MATPFFVHISTFVQANSEPLDSRNRSIVLPRKHENLERCGRTGRYAREQMHLRERQLEKKVGIGSGPGHYGGRVKGSRGGEW